MTNPQLVAVLLTASISCALCALVGAWVYRCGQRNQSPFHPVGSLVERIAASFKQPQPPEEPAEKPPRKVKL